MRVICAWCKQEIGVKEPLDNHAATHTICAPCLAIQSELQEGEAERARSETAGCDGAGLVNHRG